MNTPILFLLGAVALSALGGLVVWILSRPRPERFGSSIDTFSRDLDALAPPGSRPSRLPVAPPAGRHDSGNRQAAAPRVQPHGLGPARDRVGAPRSGSAPSSDRPKPGPRPKG